MKAIDKANSKTATSSSTDASPAVQTGGTEQILADILAGVLKVERVDSNSHFFDDLGADSLNMAHFCARIRKHGGLPSVSMKDVYSQPTIARMSKMLLAQIEQAAADQAEASSPAVEQALADILAGVLKVERVDSNSHFFDDLGADSLNMAHFCARIRKHGDLPSVSMKDVYNQPTIARLSKMLLAQIEKAAVDEAEISSPAVEQALADILAGVLKVERVDSNSHFFDDLGADSLNMAHFCARIRKHETLPSVSMKDVYSHSTIASLALTLSQDRASPAPIAPSPKTASEPVMPREPVMSESARNFEFMRCGVLQLLISFTMVYIGAVLVTQAYQYVAGASGLTDMYLRSLIFTTVAFAIICVLPILAKWGLIGRWERQEFRVWSLEYLRFWFVKSLVKTSPLVLFTGTPIYNFYLRALGAKIGRNVVIHTNHMPVCTDLLEIGDRAVIRKDSYFNCYRAHEGLIQTGPVSLGKDTLLGEMTVLDIDTQLGDGAQLGHSSSLYCGQSIPKGEYWVGSPATQRTSVDYRGVPNIDQGNLRIIMYCLLGLLPGLLILPALFGVTIEIIQMLAERPHFSAPGTQAFMFWTFFTDALTISAILFFGSLVTGLLFVGTVPRLLNLALKPGKVYPLYGIHYWLHRVIQKSTNIKFFTYLFGDSSYITNYLQWIGYDLSGVVQTGSNFGMDVKQDNPFLVTIGSGTVIADGLSVITTDYSSSSFCVSRAVIGADSFVGNFVAYPSQSKVGDNCLLANKVQVPLEGEIREGTGLLGSPSFEIPRSVLRDRNFELDDEEDMAKRLRAKNRHNLGTMGIFLFAHWFLSFIMLCLIFGAGDLYLVLGTPAVAVALFFVAIFGVGYYIFVERLSIWFNPLQPLQCSIYDQRFWSHERYWKLMTTSAQLAILDGTPFKGLAWRLLGVKIGKRVFDDGCGMTEKAMVAIGDDCTLNMASIVQPHSQEDGGFKSDKIEIGAGCTLGVGAWVHYGTKLENGAQLAPDAFLMKGQEVAANTRWAENPAREVMT